MLRNCRYTLILFFLCGTLLGTAQKVGLVLSGGGARGIAHIGLIKALEENNIPIDYIAGTSIGAIVGSMYAMGMSPEEMIALLKSEEFHNWSKGKIDKNQTHFYRKPTPNPSILDVRLRVKLSKRLDSLSIKPILPSNMISPVQMNFVFFEWFSQANAYAKRNFDKLLVPFRCVASDIYKKEAVVFSNGDLGDAVRTSMTFPFVFRPLLIDNRLLFDGGIINNFPVDVMRKDFNPDFIIGSTVSDNLEKPDIDDPVQQLSAMIMNRTDYTIKPEEGILFFFDMSKKDLFDFSKVDEYVQLGYEQTLERMDEIKKSVRRKITVKTINDRRLIFKTKFPELKFNEIYVTGDNAHQEEYVWNFFNRSKKELDVNSVKKRYFELIEDDKIQEILPHAIYNEKEKKFDLYLQVKGNDHLKFMIGGNISSTTSNQAYVGFEYQNLGRIGQSIYADAQFGTLYNGLGLGTQLDFALQSKTIFRTDFVFHRFKKVPQSRIFYEEQISSELSQLESYVKIKGCIPVKMKGRIDLGMGYGLLTDNYRQDDAKNVGKITYDKSYNSVFSAFSQFHSSSFTQKMYHTEGYNFFASIQALYGFEAFRSFEYPSQNVSKIKNKWLQFRGVSDYYISIAERFKLGTYAELQLSTRGLLHNYMATVIQLPSFEPTNHSKTVFNEAFNAPQFLAVGLKPIIKITSVCHFRNESYFFIPYRRVNRKADNSAVYSLPFSSYQYMTECSLVFNILDVAAISFFGNYYSKSPSPWNIGVNIGCLLFKDKFLK